MHWLRQLYRQLGLLSLWDYWRILIILRTRYKEWRDILHTNKAFNLIFFHIYQSCGNCIFQLSGQRIFPMVIWLSLNYGRLLAFPGKSTSVTLAPIIGLNFNIQRGRIPDGMPSTNGTFLEIDKVLCAYISSLTTSYSLYRPKK